MSFISQTAASLTTGLFSCLVPSSGGALPTDYPGLTAWYDPSDASTVTLGVGLNIVQIDDKSGNGNHASQSNASAQPILFTPGVNGLPIMLFNGSNALWKKFPSGMGGSSSHTFLMSANVSGGQVSTMFGCRDQTLGDGPFLVSNIIMPSPSIIHTVFTNLVGGTASATQTTASYTIVSGRYRSGSTEVLVEQDANSGTSSAVGATDSAAPFAPISLGSGTIVITTQPFLVNGYTGHMGEVVFYNTDIGDSAYAKLIDYIANKWS